MSAPSVEYVRRRMAMEEATTEVHAACGHPVEVRFHEGVSETDRRNGLAEVVSEPCSFCMDDFNSGIGFVDADKTATEVQ
jgi:hypothetical protein